MENSVTVAVLAATASAVVAVRCAITFELQAELDIARCSGFDDDNDRVPVPSAVPVASMSTAPDRGSVRL